MPTNSLHISMPLIAEPAVTRASWVLLFVWLVGSVVAFWFLEFRDLRSFARDDAAFAADTAQVELWYRKNLGEAPARGHPASGASFKLTLIHLYDSACRCNRFVEPDLKRLMDHYQSRGVRFFAAPLGTAGANASPPFALPAIRAQQEALAAAGVKSSPAVLIFDADGRFVYYGPYSDSAWCGSTGSLVEPALERALSGLAAVRIPSSSRGCFCG